MSYWDRVLAKSYRLQASLLARGRSLGGGSPAAAIAQLRARAAAIDPGADVERPAEARPVSLREWLRGIRSIDGEAPVVKDWVQPRGAHDAVRIGEYRRHAGAAYRSLIDYNTTEPGSDPRWWVQEDPSLDAEDDGGEVEITPWAPGLTLVLDQLVSYQGRIYSVRQPSLVAQAHQPPGSPGLEALYRDEGAA